ncbi:unnamed protein product [Clonostachys rosea]|uniref:Uncharacterized protein n=1 Tax=Bionectria ochroleuca TaxID=29856 RepID=A0ABY6V1G3_BIOOC|nr:unnamed protein product [Clonostachys rosea]
MSQSPKRPSISEASQPLSSPTEREAVDDRHESPPKHPESLSTQTQADLTVAGLDRTPDATSALETGAALTECHEPDLSNTQAELSSEKHVEPQIRDRYNVPESQILPLNNVTMSRSPKRSSSPDASNVLPNPKRHEREITGEEHDPIEEPMTPSAHGRDALKPAGQSSFQDIATMTTVGPTMDEHHGPTICDGEDELGPKQLADPPALNESRADAGQPDPAQGLHSALHLPPPGPDGCLVLGQPDAHPTPEVDRTDDLETSSYLAINDNEIDMINAVWKTFMSAVITFAYGALPKRSSWNELPAASQDEVRKWVLNPQDHLNSESPDAIANFYSAWLFRRFHRHLFSGEDPDKWNSPEWQSFGTLCASIKARISEPNSSLAAKYHHWRNLSVLTLGEMRPERRHVNPRWLRNKVEDWINHLPFASDANPFEDEWEHLLRSAINMDNLIITARRDIRLQLVDQETQEAYGFPIVPKRMKNQNVLPTTIPVEERVVDYVMLPALQVYGKTDNLYSYESEAKRALSPYGSKWDTRFDEEPMFVVIRRRC